MEKLFRITLTVEQVHALMATIENDHRPVSQQEEDALSAVLKMLYDYTD